MTQVKTTASSRGEIRSEVTPLSKDASPVAVLSGTDSSSRLARLQAWWHRPNPRSMPGDLPLFVRLFTVLRSSALLVALTLSLIEHSGVPAAAGGGALVVLAVWFTLRPAHDLRGWNVVPLLLEASVGVAVVEATGLGRSPFLISLAVTTVIAGFAGGLRIVSGLAIIAGIAVTVPSILVAQYHETAASTVQFATIFVLIGVVGGYSRQLLENAGALGQGLEERVNHLSKVNDLLFDLHSAAEHVSMPLNLEGATSWAMERLEETFAPDIAAVLLWDSSTARWNLAAGRGLSRVIPGEPFLLPPPMARVAEGDLPVRLADLEHGLSYQSSWGLYCPLRTKKDLVGLLAVETELPRPRSVADGRRMEELAAATALAVDNARRLEHLHTFAVEQERSRLARELHDHVGQSMVYMGFELDRLAELSHEAPIRRDLLALRGDLRTLVEELRDMLVDLRTDVSEDKDVVEVLHYFAERVNRRGRMRVDCTAEADRRLPLAVEREVWRVAREAVMNAERHARATRVKMVWICNGSGALLEVTDDGVGMPAGAKEATRFGLIGMRERADAIGGQLELTTGPGKGTMVRLRVRSA